jgi:hypothetical protein
MAKKIKKIFTTYIWFILPVLGIILILKQVYPDSIPLSTDVYVGIIGLLVIISLVVSLYSSFRGLFVYLISWPKRNKILKTGRPAKVKILNIEESDEGVVTVNDQPYVTLEVEVIDGDSNYKTGIKAVIGRLDMPKFQPGKILSVKIDSNDKMKVVFDPEGEIFKKENQ